MRARKKRSKKERKCMRNFWFILNDRTFSIDNFTIFFHSFAIRKHRKLDHRRHSMADKPMWRQLNSKHKKKKYFRIIELRWKKRQWKGCDDAIYLFWRTIKQLIEFFVWMMFKKKEQQQQQQYKQIFFSFVWCLNSRPFFPVEMIFCHFIECIHDKLLFWLNVYRSLTKRKWEWERKKKKFNFIDWKVLTNALRCFSTM